MYDFRKISKKIILLLLLLSDLVLINQLYRDRNLTRNVIPSLARSEKSKLYDSLLINTYLSQITKASDNFYKEYYTITPSVNYYSVSVKEVTSDNNTSYITFRTLPYLGPHDTIGIDEITFSADYLGNVQLNSFKHIISYHLPDNLKNLEKKKVPGQYWQ